LIRNVLHLIENPAMIVALATWPKFSFSSYQIVSRLVRQGIQPLTVLDVGANVGQFAVSAAKLFPGVSVHSFEPQPDCVVQLRRNVKKIGCVTVYPVALGDEEGDAEFNINAHSHSGSLLPLAEAHQEAFASAKEIGTVSVPVTTLDRVCDGLTLPGPVLLKLDVQGYEAHALRGAKSTLKRVDYLVAEVSFRPMYQGETLFLELMDLLNGAGFRFDRPVGWLPDPKTGEILQMDALFSRVR